MNLQMQYSDLWLPNLAVMTEFGTAYGMIWGPSDFVSNCTKNLAIMTCTHCSFHLWPCLLIWLAMFWLMIFQGFRLSFWCEIQLKNAQSWDLKFSLSPAVSDCRQWHTDLNTWIAGSHGFAYSSMRATGNTSAAILLQSKHLIDALTSTHISAWNATGDRFLASNFMKILRKKMRKFHRSSRLLNIYWKLLKNLLM